MLFQRLSAMFARKSRLYIYIYKTTKKNPAEIRSWHFNQQTKLGFKDLKILTRKRSGAVSDDCHMTTGQLIIEDGESDEIRICL